MLVHIRLLSAMPSIRRSMNVNTIDTNGPDLPYEYEYF